MSRNYGLGSRNMYHAGKFVLKIAADKKFISFQTAADLAARWRIFCKFAAENGVKKMEFVTEDLVLQYGIMLAKKERKEPQAKKKNDGLLAISTAQNRVSAVNTVMKHATCGKWRSVRPTANSGDEKQPHTKNPKKLACKNLRNVTPAAKSGCGISKRSNIRKIPPCGMDREQLLKSMSGMDTNDIALVLLMRDFGLRTKEASLLNAEIALNQALKHDYVKIIRGTKGGRSRCIKKISCTQIETLKYAVVAQGNRRNLITGDCSWKEWREGTLRDIRERLQVKDASSRLHEQRAAYVCGRYKELTGHDAPVLGGCAPRELDRWARLIISDEVGHGRIDVTNSYLGALT